MAINPTPLPRLLRYNLYTSHALTTWNARTYEYGAILFTASAFPDTLTASSIRGICKTLASLCLSSSIGKWIDRSPSRLRTLLITICINRVAVILACMVWLSLISRSTISTGDSIDRSVASTTSAIGKIFLFSIAIVLGVCETLSGIGNMISMERDWVPTLVTQASVHEPSPSALTHLNAVMRRIDLTCKLFGPVFINLLISAASTKVGILCIAGINSISWGIEVWNARQVWLSCPQLQEAKADNRYEEFELLQGTLPTEAHPRTFATYTRHFWRNQSSQLRAYFSTDVWIPSLSLALLYLSVLSYSATFITYLLNTGFTLPLLTVAQACSSVVEISSTVVVPFGVNLLAQAPKDLDKDEDAEGLLIEQDIAEKRHGVGLERSGLWGITLQLLCLLPVVFVIWQLNPASASSSPASGSFLPSFLTLDSLMPSVPSPTDHSLMTRLPTLTSLSPILITLLFLFLSLSRLGLFSMDLATREITQTRVPSETRSSFAGTEMAFVALFELSQWILAAIFSKPAQFKWLATGSLCAVGVAAGAYAGWVRGRRGHLIHFEKIGKIGGVC